MSVLDIVIIIVVFAVTGVTLFFGSFMFNELGQIEMIQDNIEANARLTSMSNVMYNFNNFMPYLLVALFIVTLIGAYYIDTHPIFFVASLVTLGFIIVFSGGIVEVFNQFAQEEQFATVITNYTSMIIIMQNLPAIVLIMGAAIIVMLYAKHKRGGLSGPTQ